MKKLFTASLLIVTGIALTGCTLLTKKADTNTSVQMEPPQSKTKITELFNIGRSQECNYTTTFDNTTTTGKMYISGKKMFHTATIKNEEGEMVSNYILNEDWIYTWGDNVPAMKMQLSKIQEMAPELTYEEKQKMEGNTTVNYKELGIDENLEMDCKNWNEDNRMFEIPKDIEFTDITETLKDFTKQFQQTTETIDEINDSKCAVCNMTPDENTKRECLASLGCN